MAINDLLSRVRDTLFQKTQDNQGWFRQGKFAPVQQLGRIKSDLGYEVRNAFNQGVQNAWSPQGLATKATNAIQGGINDVANWKRIELPKPQVKNQIGQAAINLAFGIPESIVNIPRNYVTGIARTGMELGKANKEGRRLNYQNLAGGIAPLTESLVDVATLGFAKPGINMVKEGAKQTIKQAIKKGGLKGAGLGAFGGLTYGLDTQYGKEFDVGEVAGNVVGGALLGGLVGSVLGGAGSVKNKIFNGYKNLGLDDKTANDLTKKHFVSTENRPVTFRQPKAQREFNAKINTVLGRPLNTPVMLDDLKRYNNKINKFPDTEIGAGLSVKKVSRDKPLEINPRASSEVTRPKIKGSSETVSQTLPWEQPGYNAKNKKQGVPKTFEEVDTAINTAEMKANEDPNLFKRMFEEWIGKRQSARTKATTESVDFIRTPEGNPIDLIKAIEDRNIKVSPKQEKYIGELRKTYDALFKEAKDSGIDMKYTEDYLTHIWDKPIDQIKMEYQAAKQKFGFASERSLPTYEEGLKLGFKPKYTHPAQILEEYSRKLRETVANIELFKKMKDQGLIVGSSGVANNPNFAPITAPGFPRANFNIGDERTVISNWYAPKNVADQINRIFTPQDTGTLGNIMSTGAKISSGVQDVTLSGGMPKTPLNAWSVAQVTKEILSGRIASPIKNFIRSISGEASNKFFQENAGQIVKMQERNVPISTTFETKNLIDKGMAKNIFGDNVGQVWDKLMNEPTFKRFMPQLQISLFNDLESAMLKKGLSPSEASDIAAKGVKNFYGIVDSATLAKRSQLGKDSAAAIFFAPRYRETMINFWINNIKALKNPLAPENITNTKFVIGATMTYIAMNELNKNNTGKNMWENPSGKEDKMLIKTKDGYIGIPFLSSIATMPRLAVKFGKHVVEGNFPEATKDVKGTLSSGIRPALDVVTNEDYFGGQIYDPESGGKWGDIGLYLAGQYNHPYVREGMNVLAQGLPAETKSKLGLNKQPVPVYQTVSKALELPFRFYNNKGGKDALQTAYYFDDRDQITKSLDSQSKQAWDILHPVSKQGRVVDNNILSSQQKAVILLNNSQVQQAEEMLAFQAKQRGEQVDPIWDLPPQWRKVVWASRVQLPGQKNTYDTLLSQQPWYSEFKNKQNVFYDTLGTESNTTTGQMAYPEPSEYVQRQMDAKNWTDPEVQAWFTAKDQYNNQQLVSLGLPIISGGQYGYAKKPKKISFKKISAPKVKITSGKVRIPKIKLGKLPKIRIVSPPKVKAIKISKPRRPKKPKKLTITRKNSNLLTVKPILQG